MIDKRILIVNNIINNEFVYILLNKNGNRK